MQDYNEQRRGAVPDLRSPEQFAGYFEGLELVEPGVVPVRGLAPRCLASAASPKRSRNSAAVGRKR